MLKGTLRCSKTDGFGIPRCCTMLFENGIYQGFFTDRSCYKINSSVKIYMVKINLGSQTIVFHYNTGELVLRPGESKVFAHVWNIPKDYEPGCYRIEGYDDAEELRHIKFYIPIVIIGY